MIKKLINSTIWSYQGLKAGYKDDQSVRMEIHLLCIALPIVFLVQASLLEKFWMSLSVVLILVVEVLNTAIEEIIDHLFKDIHPTAKKAKDLGSAAVFLCVLHSAAVWGLILAKNYLGLFKV